MHRVARARITRIPQSQRIPRSASLLSRRSTLLRSYSSDTPPISENSEQPSIGYSEPDKGDDISARLHGDERKLPPHYHLTHPDLESYDGLLDPHVTHVFPPNKKTPFVNKVIVRNETKDGRSMFQVERERIENQGGEEEASLANTTDSSEVDMKKHIILPRAEQGNLYQFPLISRRITKQTGKGKVHRMYHLIVVGNGNGLVGYGEGKDLEDSSKAAEKAFVQAVRNMDYVERFEKRTIFGDMQSKMGSTRVILRPRPIGFGLQCNPHIHQVLKAAGIKDISAKVWGSRNPINVIKTLFRMLHSGNAPLYMGDGIGGKGRRTYKGEPIQSRDAVERARGRRLFDLRT